MNEATGSESNSTVASRPVQTSIGGYRERHVPYLLLIPAMLFVLGVLGYGVMSGFVTSLHSLDRSTYELTFTGFGTYYELFTNDRFHNSLLRSLYLVFGSVTLGMVVSMSFALCLNKVQILKNLFRSISLVPWLVSGIAAAVMFRFMFSGNGGFVDLLFQSLDLEPIAWLGHHGRAMFVLILVNTWYISPFSTLILFSGLQTVDPELYDSAAIDGATGLQTFYKITIPMLKPMIGVALIWLSFSSFNMFDVVLPTTAGGPGRSTEVLALVMYRFAFNDLNYPMATGIMIILLSINVVLSIVFLKLFKM